MRFLVPAHNLDALCINVVARWLASQGHDVQQVLHPHRYGRRFIPGASHARNMANVWTHVRGRYDVAIAADPTLVLALLPLRRLGIVKRIIFWRIDWYPRKYPSLMQRAYLLVDRAAELADEVWTIYPDPKFRRVPYLLEASAITDGLPRERRAVFAGPDLDGSLPLAREAAALAGVGLATPSYETAARMLPEPEFRALLASSMVGLALYKPDPLSSKQYSDPGRIKHYLACGLPVVTTRVAPVWRELVERDAGIACDYTPESVAEAVRECMVRFPAMSQAAYAMGRG